MKAGIDLGTTFSLISHLEKDGTPTLLPDNSFKDIFATPSAVYIAEKNAAVGYLVDTLVEQNPELPVVRFFKRNFGENTPLFIDKLNNSWYPEAIGALVLKKLKYDAESNSGNTLESAVITVPAHFNDLQRKAVINAAAMADIPVLGLVEEPVAAALHYGIQQKSNDQILMVYDLGGGTFDATILSMDKDGVYVLAKDGLTEMGGKEFDEAIVNIILEQYKRNFGFNLTLNGLTSLQLRRIAEEIKIELSIPNKSFLKKPILIGNSGFEIIIYRKDFENAIRQMIEKTIEVAMRCIDGAGLKEIDINALMLVGGSSMIPYVKERMTKIFSDSKQNIFFHEPMRAVAYGASLHAAQLSGDAERFEIPPEFRGVTGYNIGIQTYNPQTQKQEIDCLIKKNMPSPAKATRTYYTSSATQTRIVLQLVQYIDTSSVINIGELILGPLTNPALNYPVEVTVENTADGTIRVEAYDPNTGIELQQDFGNDKSTGGNLAAQRNLVQATFINSIN
jgi:molecular chaperone DnaK